MINVTRWPAVILANYRTGSSALCYKLAADNNVSAHVEPTIAADRLQRFVEAYNSDTNYVVKFMPDQIDSCNLYRELLDSECYKIKLLRKNKVEQIASFYIAEMRDKWWTLSNEQEKNYFIPINADVIKKSIDRILNTDSLLNDYDKADATIYYEDLGILEDIDRKPSLKPNNIDRLLEIITNHVT